MADIRELLATLDSEPDNAQALASLEQLAGSGAALGEPASIAAMEEARRVHRERGDIELVKRLYELELAATSDRSRRAVLLLDQGKLAFEDLLDVAAAEESLKRVLELVPGDESATEVLTQIAMERGNWEKFVKKFVEEAKVQTAPQLVTSLYLRAAETFCRWQPESQLVDEHLRKALEVEPRNRRAAVHLERRLRAAKRWEDLSVLLGQRVDAAATRDERVHALAELADLSRGPLGRPDAAAEAFKKIIAIDPAHPRALRELIEAYTAEQNWSALVKLYEGALKVRRPGHAPEGELAIHLQMATILWRRLGQADAAEEYFRRVRKVDPCHAEALDFYRDYHRDRGEGAKLLQVLQQAQKAETDASRRAALAVEMATLAEEVVGNPEKAIDTWKAILRQEPKNAEARIALKRLYQKTEKWNALLELLKEEIEAISVGDEAGKKARVERLLEVVAIYRDRLSLDVMVINTYNNILTLVPDHAGALDSLAQKYEQLGRWNDLIAILQRKADAPGVPAEERARILRRIAGLWADRFGNHAQAIKPLEELLAILPGDAEATGKLKDIYVKRRQWRALLDLYSRETPLLPEADRRGHLIEMAKLAAEKLGDARASISIWNRVLEGDPNDAEALAALAGLYEREKRFPALAEILHRQKKTADPKTAVQLLEKLGTIYAERLESPKPAADAFREILAIEPRHPRAIRVLRELCAQAGDFDALEELYGSLENWDECIDVLHAIVDRLGENEQKLAVLERITRIAAGRAREGDQGLRAHPHAGSQEPARRAGARAHLPQGREVGASALHPGGPARPRHDDRGQARAAAGDPAALRGEAGLQGARVPVVRPRLRAAPGRRGPAEGPRAPGRRG